MYTEPIAQPLSQENLIMDEVDYDRKACTNVEKLAEANLPTEFGLFRIMGFRNTQSGEDFVALVKGELSPDKASLVRIHSQCLTGDVFHSLKCDCGPKVSRRAASPPGF